MVNGDAETGDFTGWDNSSGSDFLVGNFGFTSPNGGNVFDYYVTNTTPQWISQTIDISDLASDVVAGNIKAVLTGYTYKFDDIGLLKVVLEQLNGSDGLLETSQVEDGELATWESIMLTVNGLKVATRKLKITLYAQLRGDGTDFAEFDGIDLRLSQDASLPVSLVSFSARAEGRSVILNWITESETDNLGFVLERSVGADYNPPGVVDAGWQPIASYQTHDELKGQGNTSSRTEYTFTDQNVESGKAYSYRLSDVSTKGEITVYASLSVKMDKLPETTEMKNAYPNPFNPQTYIAYNLSEDTDVSITVFDLLGRNVKSLYIGHQFAGSYNVYWNATDETGNKVPSGGYIIQMKTEKTRLTQKVMLMK